MDSGTIYADGSVRIHGTVPTKTRIVAISRSHIAIHHPGGSYWDNSGQNYVSAWIEVLPLVELKRGNEAGTFIYRVERRGAIRFHPTPKVAVRAAMAELERIVE